MSWKGHVFKKALLFTIQKIHWKFMPKVTNDLYQYKLEIGST